MEGRPFVDYEWVRYLIFLAWRCLRELARRVAPTPAAARAAAVSVAALSAVLGDANSAWAVAVAAVCLLEGCW